MGYFLSDAAVASTKRERLVGCSETGAVYARSNLRDFRLGWTLVPDASRGAFRRDSRTPG